jgi:hypothetical protein
MEPGLVPEPRCHTKCTELNASGCKFYDDKYKAHFDNVFSTVGDRFKAMGDDKLNQPFGEHCVKLTRDLLFDSEGSLKFKPKLWGDIRMLMLLMLVDKVR